MVGSNELSCSAASACSHWEVLKQLAGGRPVAVVGHRNPDTDAVISAISLTHLLRKVGVEATPYCAGPPQPETRVVLEKVGLHTPALIGDLRLRASDIMRSTPTLREGDPLKRAVDLIVEGGVDAVPILDSLSRVKGVFTTASFASFWIRELASMRLTLEDTPVRNFIEVSGAKLISGAPDSRLSGRVYVAALSEESIGRRGEELRGQILVVGDRRDVQLTAIRAGVSALIVTGGFEVSGDVVEAAVKAGTIVAVSPHDTYTTLRLLDMSRPVERFADPPHTVSGDATIAEVREALTASGAKVLVVTDELGRFSGIVSRADIVGRRGKPVALVDHNEFSQSVEGVEEAEILAVVDHHRVGGDVETANPVVFRVEPLGSTNTVIWRMMRECSVEPGRELAEAMLYAILSDTMLLKSPTTTPADREAVEALAEAAGVEVDTALAFMRIAMAANEPSDPQDIVGRDLKVYEVRGVRFGIAQVFTTRPENYLTMLPSIKAVMDRLRRVRGLRFLALMITDCIDSNTYLVVSGDSRIVEEALGVEVGAAGYALLKGVTSRKSQVLPKILKCLAA